MPECPFKSCVDCDSWLADEASGVHSDCPLMRISRDLKRIADALESPTANAEEAPLNRIAEALEREGD